MQNTEYSFNGHFMFEMYVWTTEFLMSKACAKKNANGELFEQGLQWAFIFGKILRFLEKFQFYLQLDSVIFKFFSSPNGSINHPNPSSQFTHSYLSRQPTHWTPHHHHHWPTSLNHLLYHHPHPICPYQCPRKQTTQLLTLIVYIKHWSCKSKTEDSHLFLELIPAQM